MFLYWRVLQAWETCRWTSHSLPVTGKTLWKYQMYVSLKSFRYRVRKKEMMRKWAWVKDNFLQSCNKEEERNLSSEFPILLSFFFNMATVNFSYKSALLMHFFSFVIFFFFTRSKKLFKQKEKLVSQGTQLHF